VSPKTARALKAIVEMDMEYLNRLGIGPEVKVPRKLRRELGLLFNTVLARCVLEDQKQRLLDSDPRLGV
jgi:hypothetical protein